MISMNLHALRKVKKMTLEEVAEKIDVSRQAVAKWENGESVPDIEKCNALAKLFNVSLDELVNGEHKEGIPLLPKGKHVFGTVTVGERGQIVIPKKAREIFGIRPGDSLMVLGDENQGGIALIETGYFARGIEFLLEHAKETLPNREEQTNEEG